MIKISASFTKKVPGDEPYSSDGVHLGVEVELPDEILRDQQQFSQAVRRLFAQAKCEVEEQVAAPRPQISSNGNGHANGHRPNRQLASKKQLDFLLSLARRNGNLGPQDVLNELGAAKLTDITRSEASALIDRFNGAGR